MGHGKAELKGTAACRNSVTEELSSRTQCPHRHNGKKSGQTSEAALRPSPSEAQGASPMGTVAAARVGHRQRVPH